MKDWFKSGSPWIWLNGGAVAISMIMVIGLIGLIAVRGFGHFWAADVARIEITDHEGKTSVVLGELVRSQTIPTAVARDAGYHIPQGIDLVTRHLIKQGNRDQTGRDFVWHLGLGMAPFEYPEDAYVIERREWGNFYGQPVALLRGGEIVASAAEADFRQQLQAAVTRSLELHKRIKRLEKRDIGRINRDLERLRLDERSLELQDPPAAVRSAEEQRIEEHRAVLDAEYAVLRKELDLLYTETKRDSLRMRMNDGKEVDIGCSIGVAPVGPEPKTAAEVLSQADFACHLAKREGRNLVRCETDLDRQQSEVVSNVA